MSLRTKAEKILREHPYITHEELWNELGKHLIPQIVTDIMDRIKRKLDKEKENENFQIRSET